MGAFSPTTVAVKRTLQREYGKPKAYLGNSSIHEKNKRIDIKIKISLFEALVLSKLRYAAETSASTKKLRRIFAIMWRDKVRNEDIKRRTRTEELKIILRTRLQWLGHVHKMDERRPPRRVLK